MERRKLLLGAAAVLLAGCGRKEDGRPTTGPTESARSTGTIAVPPAAPTATPSPAPIPEPTATPIHAGPRDQPLGFPIDLAFRLGLVVGEPGARSIRWGEGPPALEYTREDQPSDDPVRANRCGWNARVHVEYEGQPAVDWYIPAGTSVYATMDGTATLLVNTASNPFDIYGVGREPYIGNPDRARAPVSPFPGPGGGQGAFVRVENAGFVTDYGHLYLPLTASLVPAGAFLPPYATEPALEVIFAPLRDFRVASAVARWEVRRGDVIGISGDSGYSEAPHLHYTIRRAGSGSLLCPTTEAGFADNGWLLR